MSAYRRIVFWIFVLSAIGFGVFAYYEIRNNKKPTVDALSLLPDSCMVYMNTNDFFELNKKINSQSLIADKMQVFEDIDLFCRSLSHLDSLFGSNEEIVEELQGSTLHFALYSNSEFLITLNIKQLGRQEQIEVLLSELLKAHKNTHAVFSFKLNKHQTLMYQLESGVIAVSNSDALIRNALKGEGPKFENSISFLRFKANITESSLLGIYVNETLYAGSKSDKKLNLSALCGKGFIAGGIELEPSELRSSGYLVPDSSILFSHLLNQEAQSTDELLELLPQNTYFFECYGFSSYIDVFSKLPSASNQKHSTYWKNIEQSALYPVKKEFDENVAGHIINFEMVGEQKFIALQIADTLKAENYLTLMSDSIVLKEAPKVFRLKQTQKVETLQLFAPLFHTKTAYVLLMGQELFFAEEEQTIRNLRVLLNNKFTLRKNENFVQYKNQQIAQDYNYLLYNSPSQRSIHLNSVLNFQKTGEKEPYENFKHFSYSLTTNDKQFKYRFHLLYQTETKETNTLWTLKLDTVFLKKPEAFINHNTKENELVVQDLKNNLYLVNAKGSIIWKKKLTEEILSEIHLVDMYKNNKYQMLFSTRNYIHLIDRNGKNVDGYPIKLPAPASSPLSVFDYDKTKDYRIFIACKNRMIYNYSIFGTKQEGFVPVKTEAEVVVPIQFAEVSESQYLVALDVEGKIYTFSRRGVGRIGLRNRTVANCTSFYVDAANSINNTYLVYFDEKDGLINKISFDDRKEIVKLSQGLDSAFVNFQTVDENKSTDLMITKAHAIKAFDFSGSLLLEYRSQMQLSLSKMYRDESHSFLYMYSELNATLELYDLVNQGKKIFPASGMPLISNLFKDNKKYMVFGSGDRLNCVLVN